MIPVKSILYTFSSIPSVRKILPLIFCAQKAKYQGNSEGLREIFFLFCQV